MILGTRVDWITTRLEASKAHVKPRSRLGSAKTFYTLVFVNGSSLHTISDVVRIPVFTDAALNGLICFILLHLEFRKLTKKFYFFNIYLFDKCKK